MHVLKISAFLGVLCPGGFCPGDYVWGIMSWIHARLGVYSGYNIVVHFLLQRIASTTAMEVSLVPAYLAHAARPHIPVTSLFYEQLLSVWQQRMREPTALPAASV